MANITSQFSFAEHARSGYQRTLASITAGLTGFANARARRALLEALQQRSDAELAGLGLRRDQIAAFVFRDTPQP